MIQNHRFGTGIHKYLQSIPIKDDSLTSDAYFRILDPPDRLYVGKTSFRLRANFDTLVHGSTIYIDIIDSAGNTIYHEIIDFVGKDRSRLIVIHIYENTPPGEATIYIAGRAKWYNNQELPYNNNADSWDYLHYPNVVWRKQVVIIPTDQNDSEVLFLSPPEVDCHERIEYFSSAPVSARKKVVVAPTESLASLQSTIQPYQYSNSSKYSTSHIESGKYLDLDPSGSSAFIQSKQIQVPEYFGFNTINSTGIEFNKDMVGGTIIIKNPANLDLDYSASIVKIIDRNTIQVDAPFVHTVSGSNIKSFVGSQNFTASYISRDVQVTSFETESFVQLDFRNLEPIAGIVDKIQVSYKPYGTFGEFINIGEFPVREQNYLVNSSSLLPDKISIIEQPIGDLSGSGNYGTYWNFNTNSRLNLYTSLETAYTFDRGFSAFYSASAAVSSSTTDYLAYIKLKDDYTINAAANTEFKLELSTRYSPQTTFTNILSDYKHQQIDVFISGAHILTDDNHNRNLNTLLSTKEFGTYVGSITTEKGTTQLDSKLYFKTLEAAPITPIFVIRSGNGWEFKEITLAPRAELGYSPNQCKLMVPIDTLKTNIELVLKLEYLSGTGIKSDRSTTLYGLSFTGTGFPKDRLFSGSGIVSSSRQFSTGSYTGSFHGTFFGIPTGSAGIQYYQTHTQAVAATTWSFGHGLSWRYPIINVWDENHEVVIPEKIKADSVYLSTIYFPIPQSGYAVATVGSIMPTGSLHFDNIIGKPGLHSSSQQVNIYETLSSSYHRATSLYAGGNAAPQSAFTPTPVKWQTSPIGLHVDNDVWISQSYMKLESPGTYEIEANIRLNTGSNHVNIFSYTDRGNLGSYTTESIYSGSVNPDTTVRVNYLHYTTGSADVVGLWWHAASGNSIPIEQARQHSYLKITKIAPA